MTRKTVTIGRSSHADIVIADDRVDAHHSELVITASGRMYLTDRASETGTYLAAGEDWVTIRQTFIEDEDRLRFGGFQCTGADLRQRARQAAIADAGGEGGAGRRGAGQLRGAVERDPATGEIVRRKF